MLLDLLVIVSCIQIYMLASSPQTGTYLFTGSDWATLGLALLVIFTCEMLLHMFAFGIASYFRRKTHVLDFVCNIAGIAFLAIFIFSPDFYSQHVMLHSVALVIRLLRVLRVLNLMQVVLYELHYQHHRADQILAHNSSSTCTTITTTTIDLQKRSCSSSSCYTSSCSTVDCSIFNYLCILDVGNSLLLRQSGPRSDNMCCFFFFFFLSGRVGVWVNGWKPCVSLRFLLCSLYIYFKFQAHGAYHAIATVTLQPLIYTQITGNPLLAGTAYEKYAVQLSFDNVLEAMQTLFTVGVIANWNIVMDAAVRATSIASYVYFYIFRIVVFTIFFPIFVGFVIESFVSYFDQIKSEAAFSERQAKLEDHFTKWRTEDKPLDPAG